MSESRDKTLLPEGAPLISGAPSAPALGEPTNAVQTPPPATSIVTSAEYDSESPTIMDAATVIEIPTPFDAPTLLGAPIVELPYRPVASPQAPKSNWSESLVLPTGTVLGNRYEILQLLGQGGMGAV